MSALPPIADIGVANPHQVLGNFLTDSKSSASVKALTSRTQYNPISWLKRRKILGIPNRARRKRDEGTTFQGRRSRGAPRSLTSQSISRCLGPWGKYARSE
jgi:hypothetical protein